MIKARTPEGRAKQNRVAMALAASLPEMEDEPIQDFIKETGILTKGENDGTHAS